jgi:hypothetical protein
VTNVKKLLVTFLLVGIMVMSFAVPAMAGEAVVAEPVPSYGEQTITPHTEMTRLYWRTSGGRLQFRQWSITNGRWLTDWTDAGLL